MGCFNSNLFKTKFVKCLAFCKLKLNTEVGEASYGRIREDYKIQSSPDYATCSPRVQEAYAEAYASTWHGVQVNTSRMLSQCAIKESMKSRQVSHQGQKSSSDRMSQSDPAATGRSRHEHVKEKTPLGKVVWGVQLLQRQEGATGTSHFIPTSRRHPSARPETKVTNSHHNS